MKYLVFLMFLICTYSFGQNSEQEKIQQLEQQKASEKARQVRLRIDTGIFLLNKGEYALADEKFKFALANMKSIPSDLTFYFGKNSFYMGRFKQCIDWLSKYIQLKGTSGQFSEEAAELLKKSEEALVGERVVESQKAEEVFSKDFLIDCGPSGKVSCPVCNGTTVVIRKDYFGETYKTCVYCDHGMLSCEDYNKLLKGQLKPQSGR